MVNRDGEVRRLCQNQLLTIEAQLTNHWVIESNDTASAAADIVTSPEATEPGAGQRQLAYELHETNIVRLSTDRLSEGGYEHTGGGVPVDEECPLVRIEKDVS